MEPIEGDKLRGHLESLVLAALETGPAHGWEIWRRLEGAGQGALRLREGSLYPALHRLEGEGLVAAQWDTGDTERAGPRRRTYRLTSKGKRRLQQARAQWQQFATVIGGILGGIA